MANIIDYMDWRGDITFEQSGLNEVDGLIFSQLAYIPFDGLLESGFSEYRTIEDIGSAFFSVYSEDIIDTWTDLLKNCCLVLKKMMETDRFRKLLLFNYCSEFDPEESKQFAAVTINLSDDTCYIAFRGTDDSIAGWEEDFKACYMMPVPAQSKAAEYVRYVLDNYNGKIYIGGHSKGGNLAVYASMVEGYKDKERIIRVQNYDGPGFLQEYVESEGYRKIVDIVDSYTPKASIVGMIMFREDESVIVESSEKGFMQHTGISWQILGKHFQTADSYENFSMVFSKANKIWINEISMEERELFIEIVFKVLKSGFDTVTGLKEGFFNTATTILKSYNNVDKETRKMIRKIIGQIIKLSTSSYKETKKEIKNLEEKAN